MSWFGGGGRTAADTAEPDESSDREVFRETLPPTLPVVKETVDSLTKLAVKQRVFLMDHADKVKLELLKEKEQRAEEKSGSWSLNGFAIQDEEAVDVVRACPDLLSNLSYASYQSSTDLWTRISSWLRFSEPSERRLDVVEDLGYVLSVAECVEVAGHLLGAVSYALTDAAPSSGEPLRRELAYELVASRHRGSSHSMYLVAEVLHEAQRIGHKRTANTLRVATSLYIYEPLVLGGARGVAVNVSGVNVDDLPTADVDRGELKNLLSSKGHFVASATSDFVLDPSLAVSSERAAKIAYSSTDKLVTASNESLASFFADEAASLANEREERRRIAKAVAEQERKEKELRVRREEEAAERLRAAQEAEYEEEMARRAEEAETRGYGPYGEYANYGQYGPYDAEEYRQY